MLAYDVNNNRSPRPHVLSFIDLKMDLFVVNRFQDDQEETKPNEDLLRQKFFDKIEERKKRKHNEVLEPAERRKKGKSQNVSEPAQNGVDRSETQVAESGITEEAVKKVKRKKKKKKGNEGLVAGTDNALGDGSQTAFPVLGSDNWNKNVKVKRVLPQWLAKPSIVSVDLKNLTVTIYSFPKLEKIFVDRLKKNGITHFFPVQAQLIPWLLGTLEKPLMYWPNDVCVSAPTGSGKTLAFVLPIAQALLKRVVPQVRALVVLPVQDLAAQVYKVFETYCSGTDLKVVLLSSVHTFQQEQGMLVKQGVDGVRRSGCDIVVTTPGRLVSHLQATEGLTLKHLRFLVIDEADRMMESIQNDWLYHVNKHLFGVSTQSYQVPPLTVETLLTRQRPPQKLLFSATLSQDPEKLQQLGLFQPKLFTSVVKGHSDRGSDLAERPGEFIGKFTTPAELTEMAAVCQKASKPLSVHHVVTTQQWRHVLCFTKSAVAARRLALLLKALSRGRLKVARLAADLSPARRKKLLANFAAGQLDMLVSTDSLARGIDIPGVRYVVSYDVPRFVKTYVHRIGRTGRAGNQGTALTLLLPHEVSHFHSMIEAAGKQAVQDLVVPEEELEQYSELYSSALGEVRRKLDVSRHAGSAKRRAKKHVKLRTPASKPAT